MNAKQSPLDRLRHHVTGAIERGEASVIVAKPQLYHLEAHRDNGRKTKLTLSPMTHDECCIMKSKFTENTKPWIVLVPAPL